MSLSSPSSEKVTFFFVGVGKCGTSWLYAFFKRHELLSLPSIKEPYLIDCNTQKREKMVRSLYAGNNKKADFSNLYYWDQENPKKMLGLLRLLGTLKESQSIRHFLFREIQRNEPIDRNFGTLQKTIDQLDHDYQNLLHASKSLTPSK